MVDPGSLVDLNKIFFCSSAWRTQYVDVDEGQAIVHTPLAYIGSVCHCVFLYDSLQYNLHQENLLKSSVMATLTPKFTSFQYPFCVFCQELTSFVVFQHFKPGPRPLDQRQNPQEGGSPSRAIFSGPRIPLPFKQVQCSAVKCDHLV